MEDCFFPQPAWMLDAIHERIVPLPGHEATSNQTLGEMARRNRIGL
jgi:2-oxoisovalerate dehydrogenase E1 component